MTTTKDKADCMMCHNELSLEFIANVTPRVFFNDKYRMKRASDLLSRERSLLPGTQHLVEEKKEKIKKKEKIQEKYDEILALQTRIQDVYTEINTIKFSEPKKNIITKKFIMRCMDDDCRGFLSSAWKCGTCDKYTCSKCRVVKGDRNGENHICKEDDIATTNLLVSETKQCPNCAIPIFKIDGCDQMWCVQCRTPFSWNTGLKVSGTIHNPHYYNWQKEMTNGPAPRVPGDNRPLGGDCGEMPWLETIDVMIKRVKKEEGYEFENWSECYRMIEHIRRVVLPHYPATIDLQENADLRVQFLMNEINEKEWLKGLRTRQKKSEKNREIFQILEMFITSLADLFVLFARGKIKNIGAQAANLRYYVNNHLQKTSKNYNNVVPIINENWSVQLPGQGGAPHRRRRHKEHRRRVERRPQRYGVPTPFHEMAY